MEPKKLYFLLATATTIGAVAGAMGDDVVFSDTALAGYHQTLPIEQIIRPTPPGIVTQLQNRIASQSCGAIDATFGVSTCAPELMDYDIVYRRKNGVESVVRRYPQLADYAEREPTEPIVASWIDGKLDSVYCQRVNARYGGSVCDGASIDYRLRFIRTGGLPRTIVNLETPVFCTMAPPVDPNPPDPGI